MFPPGASPPEMGLSGLEPPFEYPDMPFLQQEAKERENSNVESNEEIAVYEMKQRIRQLEKQGLPESPI